MTIINTNLRTGNDVLRFIVLTLLSPEVRTLEDEDLVVKYMQTQSDYYFDLIYNRFSNKVYRKCVLMLGNKESASDATQDIFIKLFNNLSKYNGKARLSTWIFSITYNHCIDILRVSKKKYVEEIKDNIILKSSNDDEILDKEIFELEINKIEQIFDQLHPDEKALLLMKYIDGASIKDLAEMYNKNESAIKMKIMRTKEKVRMYYVKMFSNEEQ
jgi:RNA polymerase sigma factor (sigma-70 family)